MQEYGAFLDTYCGKFVMVDRNHTHLTKEAQYVFYNPKDLLEDSYSQSDVASVERLIAGLLPSETEAPGLVCVLIPNETCKDIGSWTDEPLLRAEIGQVVGQPLDKDACLSYIDKLSADYDGTDRLFSINLPYHDTGIYLWHKYI